ncbi:MAG TPA: hypothetical protein VJ775_05255 [Sphingomicrobium sp.]|nr:hypothetical protein [Sphingomicrobium sp.]
MVEEEKFFAWLDGELPAEEAAQVEAEVAADPELSRKAEEHRAVAARVKGAFGAIASAPVPDRIAAAARPAQENVVDLGKAREARSGRRSLPFWMQAASMAATLAVGIFAGNVLSGGAAGPIETEDGRLVASGDLEEALYAQLASAPAGQGPRIGLTYRDRTGVVCRTFQDEGASGLACREGGDWRIRGLFQGGEREASDYRMAAGPDPRLMDMVDESIDGEPFDQGQERAALEQGWR